MGVLIDTNRRAAIKIDVDTLMIQDAIDANLSDYLKLVVTDASGIVKYQAKAGDHRFEDVDDIDQSDVLRITCDDADGSIKQFTSQITDGNIWEIQATGTISGASVTVDIDYIHLDLDALVLNDAAANAIILQAIDIDWNGLTATGVSLSSLTSITLEHPTTGAFSVEKAINIIMDKTVANAAQILTGSRDINGEVTGAVALTNYLAVLGQASAHSAGDFIVTQTAATAGILQLNLDHTTTVACTAPDVFASTVLDINISADVDVGTSDAKIDASPRAIDIAFTIAETDGIMRMAATDIFRILATIPNGLSSAGAFQFDMLELNADAVILNDANITFNALYIDGSGLTNTSSAEANLLSLIAPDDSSIDAMVKLIADGTATVTTVNINSSRDLTGTLVATPTFTNYSVILGQEVAHTITDTIVTHNEGILQLVLNHDTDIITTAPDVFSATALSILITADADDQVAGTGADLDISARGVDIAYTLVESAGIVRMAESDIFRIVATIPNGLSSAGAFQFDMLELNADAVILNDANITFHALYIDATALTLTDCAAYYGLEVDIPLDVGQGFARAAIFASDQTHYAKLADGSLGVAATGINDEMYYKCEDFDEEAVAVTLGGGLRADEWTVGGTGASADDVTYIAGAGGVIELETDGADNDSVGAYWIGTNILVASNPILEFRFRVDGIGAADVSCLLGLTETLNILDINNIAAVSDDICCIGMNSDLGNPENVRLWTNDTGAAETVSDLSVALSANVWCTVRFDCTDTEQIRVWINNTGGAISASDEISVADVGAGTIQSGIAMFPFIFVQSLDASPSTTALEVDYVKIWQERS